MTGCPCPISREYRSAFPTRTRASRGRVLGLGSGKAEPACRGVAHADARIATTRARLMVPKLYSRSAEGDPPAEGYHGGSGSSRPVTRLPPVPHWDVGKAEVMSESVPD